MFQVEKDVPIPVGAGTKWVRRYPWSEMAVGDSFAVPEVEDGKNMRETVRSSAWHSGKARGHRYSVRLVEENGSRLIRVWRIA